MWSSNCWFFLFCFFSSLHSSTQQWLIKIMWFLSVNHNTAEALAMIFIHLQDSIFRTVSPKIVTYTWIGYLLNASSKTCSIYDDESFKVCGLICNAEVSCCPIRWYKSYPHKFKYFNCTLSTWLSFQCVLLFIQFKRVYSFQMTFTDLQWTQLYLTALNFNVMPVLLLRLKPIESAALMTVLL